MGGVGSETVNPRVTETGLIDKMSRHWCDAANISWLNQSSSCTLSSDSEFRNVCVETRKQYLFDKMSSPCVTHRSINPCASHDQKLLLRRKHVLHLSIGDHLSTIVNSDFASVYCVCVTSTTVASGSIYRLISVTCNFERCAISSLLVMKYLTGRFEGNMKYSN